MFEQKTKILKHIHQQIDKNKSNLLSRYLKYYKLYNMFKTKTFELSNYDNSNMISEIIKNLDTEKKSILIYMHKGCYFDYNNININYIICLKGCVEIEYNNIPIIMDCFSKKIINGNKFNCRAIENSFLLILF